MTNELIVRQEMTPSVWQMIEAAAPAMFRSRLFGVSTPEQAQAIMLKGYELGLGLAASFEFIQMVQGKPGLSPRGALALCIDHPKIKSIKITRLTDDKGNFVGYECYAERSNGFAHTERWTMADAKRAGLVKSGSGWEAYPENMCKWRVIGFCLDVVAPDITAGMTALMINAPSNITFTAGGDVIDAVVTPSMDDLISKYGAEAVLAAAGGELPSDATALRALAEKLEAANEHDNA